MSNNNAKNGNNNMNNINNMNNMNNIIPNDIINNLGFYNNNPRENCDNINSNDSEEELDMREKIIISENTMPGFFISIMTKSNKPISENDLHEAVLPRINELRKPDGSRYKDNLNKVVKSTLCCSGIFQLIDTEKKLWFYKQDDALHYINRNVEKVVHKKDKDKDRDRDKNKIDSLEKDKEKDKAKSVNFMLNR